MRSVSALVCGVVVVAAAAAVSFAPSAGAATPYDFCDKTVDNHTAIEAVTCTFTAGSHTFTLPKLATDITLYAVGGHGAPGRTAGTPAPGPVPAPFAAVNLSDGAFTPVTGRPLTVIVGGNAIGSAGGYNGGGSGSDTAGGGGGATTVVDDSNPMVVVPGSGGGGAEGADSATGRDVPGGEGSSFARPATAGADSGTNPTFRGGAPGHEGQLDGSGGAGGVVATPDGSPSVPSGEPGQAGSVSVGGDGGSGVVAAQNGTSCAGRGAGGGGGGGYYGGGGGGAGAASVDGAPHCGAGGGGGSGTYLGDDHTAFTDTGSTDADPVVTIAWKQSLTITSGDVPDGRVGESYSFQFTSDVPGTTFRVVSGATPPGLVLNRDGLLVGSPTTAASYGFTVEAADPFRSALRTTVQSVNISNPPTSGPVTFTRSAPPAATIGAPYSFTFAASHCPGCSFTRTGGAFPPGLSLATNGVLSGSATAAGTYGVTVRATDTAGRHASVRTTVKAAPRPQPAQLAIDDTSAAESVGSLTFPVRLQGTPTSTVTVKYRTRDSTAMAPSDYTATSGTLRFYVGGKTTKYVTVRIVDDTVHEDAERFTVELSEPIGALLSQDVAQGTIEAGD